MSPAPPAEIPTTTRAQAPAETILESPAGSPTTVPIEQAVEQVHFLFDRDYWLIFGQRVLLVGLVIVVTLVVLGATRRLLDRLQREREIPDPAMLPIRKLLRWLILVVAALLAIQVWGVPMTTLWAALGTVLALISVGFIAVWSVISHIACSVLLMIFKPFRIGDYVELIDKSEDRGVGGRVVDLTLMYVVLREEPEDGSPAALVQVPNNLFFQKTVRRRAGRRSIPLDQHVDKHGLTGRELKPPT